MADLQCDSPLLTSVPLSVRTKGTRSECRRRESHGKRTRRQRGFGLMIVDDCSPVGGVLRRDKGARGDVSAGEWRASGRRWSRVWPRPPPCQASPRQTGAAASASAACVFAASSVYYLLLRLFVIAAKQISPQGAIKLELNSTELHWKERHGTAGSLATASWCKEPELEEYAHTINPKRAQTKVPRIRIFPPAFVRNLSFIDI